MSDLANKIRALATSKAAMASEYATWNSVLLLSDVLPILEALLADREALLSAVKAYADPDGYYGGDPAPEIAQSDARLQKLLEGEKI